MNLACHKDQEEKKVEREGYESINLTRAVSDILLPTQLWDQMEGVYQSSFSKGFGAVGLEPGAAKEETKSGIISKVEVPTQYMTLKVFLTEEDVDALGGKNYEFTFGLGGGELDLKNYVKKGKKKFNFVISLGESVEAKDRLKVFFLSNSLGVKTGLLDWGAGCNKYMDITSYFSKTLSGKGIIVNSSNLRYLRVLGGAFFFALSKNSSLYLAALKVTDSRYPQIFCK